MQRGVGYSVRAARRLPINFFPVSDLQNFDYQLLVLDVVHNSVVADPKLEPLSVGQLLIAIRARIGRQGINGGDDGGLGLTRYLAKFSGGGRLDDY